MNGEWNNKTCPLCGIGTMHDGVSAETSKYRGRVFVSQRAQATCDSCGETLVYDDPDDEARWTAFRDSVDAAARQELKANRELLGLSQSSAAEIAGGGHNAFSRYERGEAKPMKAISLLFKILARHPELLQEAAIESGLDSWPGLALRIQGAYTSAHAVHFNLWRMPQLSLEDLRFDLILDDTGMISPASLTGNASTTVDLNWYAKGKLQSNEADVPKFYFTR